MYRRSHSLNFSFVPLKLVLSTFVCKTSRCRLLIVMTTWCICDEGVSLVLFSSSLKTMSLFCGCKPEEEVCRDASVLIGDKEGFFGPVTTTKWLLVTYVEFETLKQADSS